MGRPKKNEFSKKTTEMLGRRAGYKCSNPECNAPTIGPSQGPDSYNRVGEAAHIYAASPNGPRYNPNISSDIISSLDNGIWLCLKCHKEIDNKKDVFHYTPELLHEWKNQREETAKRELGVAQQAQIEKNSYISDSKNIDKGSSDITFSTDIKYKKFNFPSVGNYLINYLNDEKIPRVTDKKDSYMKKVLDWFVGLRKFPKKELNELYKNFDDSLLNINKDILVIRRQALIEYFSGRVENSMYLYNSIFEQVEEKDNMPNWYKNDYLVDGRNLTAYINPINRWPENNKYQKKMNDNDIYVTYPIIDRLEMTLLNKVIDNTINNDFKSRGTQIFGFGAEEVFLNIQRIIYVSVLCGSITQLNIIRNVIAKVCLEYAQSFNDEDLYLKALILYALVGKHKEYKNISSKISSQFRKVESQEHVNEILKLRSSINPNTKNEFDIFVFNQFGRLLNDEDFLFYENKILKLLKSKHKIYIYDALKSLYSNIERFNKKDELFLMLLKLAKQKYSREVQIVLMYINYESLDLPVRQIVKEIIKVVLNTKEYLYITELLTEIKSLENISDYDYILMKENTNNNLTYQILSNNNYEEDELEKLIDELSKEYNRIFKTGVITKGATNYSITSQYFENYSDKLNTIIENKIIPLAEKSLSHKNIEYLEKIKMLRILIYIHFYDSKYDKKIRNIINNVWLTSSTDIFEDEYDKKYLEIYINTLSTLIDGDKLNKLLKQFILICDDKYFIEHISYLISYLNSKISYNNEDYLLISILVDKSLKSDKPEFISCGVKLSKVLIKTSYFNDILPILIELSSDCNFEVASSLITLLLNEKNNKLLNPIKNNLINHNNYNIRYMVKKHLCI